jgi:hypothetical protein
MHCRWLCKCVSIVPGVSPWCVPMVNPPWCVPMVNTMACLFVLRARILAGITLAQLHAHRVNAICAELLPYSAFFEACWDVPHEQLSRLVCPPVGLPGAKACWLGESLSTSLRHGKASIYMESSAETATRCSLSCKCDCMVNGP